MYSLEIKKESLLNRMKELLLVNDVYNLQKVKKEYDFISKKIKRNGSIIPQVSKFEPPKQDTFSGYSSVKFENKVNPRHLKYYNEFKSPVKESNILLYKRMAQEEQEDLDLEIDNELDNSPEEETFFTKEELIQPTNLPIHIKDKMEEIIKNAGYINSNENTEDLILQKQQIG